jgi:lysozyme
VRILYVPQEFYDPYGADGFASHPLWVRDIFKRPALRGGRDWQVWQFANRGRLPGVETFIDLDGRDDRKRAELIAERLRDWKSLKNA